jgi:nicotinamide riboside transporter PnuC
MNIFAKNNLLTELTLFQTIILWFAWRRAKEEDKKTEISGLLEVRDKYLMLTEAMRALDCKKPLEKLVINSLSKTTEFYSTAFQHTQSITIGVLPAGEELEKCHSRQSQI